MWINKTATLQINNHHSELFSDLIHSLIDLVSSEYAKPPKVNNDHGELVSDPIDKLT